VRGRREGVGRATTQSVVSAIFLIIVADAVFIGDLLLCVKRADGAKERGREGAMSSGKGHR